MLFSHVNRPYTCYKGAYGCQPSCYTIHSINKQHAIVIYPKNKNMYFYNKTIVAKINTFQPLLCN